MEHEGFCEIPALYYGNNTLEETRGKTQGKIEFSKSQWFELIQSIQHVRIEVLVVGRVSF